MNTRVCANAVFRLRNRSSNRGQSCWSKEGGFSFGLPPRRVASWLPSESGGRSQLRSPHTFSSWFNAAAFTAPSATQTTETTEQPGAIRGPGFRRTDLSLFKNIKFTERFNGQFRFEIFNTFNHTNPICCGSTNFISTLYNTITSTRDPRILQRGLKLNF